MNTRERFWNKVELFHGATDEDCWCWVGSKTNNGYGRINVEGINQLAHRVSFELHKSSIPKGLYVLHHCDNRPCINPSHLFLGTHEDNMKDMAKKNRQWNKRKTHCSKGHAFSKENTIVAKNGYRNCRECHRICDRNKAEIKRRSKLLN